MMRRPPIKKNLLSMRSKLKKLPSRRRQSTIIRLRLGSKRSRPGLTSKKPMRSLLMPRLKKRLQMGKQLSEL